jgi:PPP family 3-phenylpropionic acid transporter
MLRFSVHYFLLFAMIAVGGPYFQLLLKARGFPKTEIGVLQGLMAGAAVAGSLMMGYLADALGKRKALLTVCVAGYGVLMTPLARTSSFAVAAVVCLGLGMVARTSVPLTDTLASSELPDPQSQYGQVRVWGSIGYVVVLALIAVFSLVNEESAASILRAVLVAVVFVVISSATLPDRHRREHSRNLPHGVPRGFDVVFWIFLAASACNQFGMASHYSFAVLFMKEELGMPKAAWVWALGAAVEIPFMFYSARIIRRAGIVRVMMFGMACVSIRLMIYAALPYRGPVLGVQLLHGFSFALYHASAIEFIRRKVAAERRAWAMALYAAVGGALPSLAGSSLGGYLAEDYGYSTLYLAYAGAPLIGIALLALFRRRMLMPAAAVTG